MKILHLTLNKMAFDIMVTGEKCHEYRKPSKWIISRLFNKDGSAKKFDLVKFTHGYGNDKPYFIALSGNIGGLHLGGIEHLILKYSNGLEVRLDNGDIIIELGKIIERGNIK